MRRMAGILAGNQHGLRQDLRRAWGKILKIANRRRYDMQYARRRMRDESWLVFRAGVRVNLADICRTIRRGVHRAIRLMAVSAPSAQIRLRTSSAARRNAP